MCNGVHMCMGGHVNRYAWKCVIMEVWGCCEVSCSIATLLPILFMEVESVHWTESSPIGSSCKPSCLWAPLPLPPQSWAYRALLPAKSFLWVLGILVLVLSLCSKCFMHWAISRAPVPLFSIGFLENWYWASQQVQKERERRKKEFEN